MAKNAGEPSTTSRQHASAAAKAKPKKKRKRGRPEDSGFLPSDQERAAVELMAGALIPQDEIARTVFNPLTGKPISPVTLRKHFRDELDNGIAKVKAKIAVNGLRLSEKNGAVAIFLMKTRLGYKETLHLQHSGKVEGQGPALTDEQIDRRILQLQENAARRKAGGARAHRR